MPPRTPEVLLFDVMDTLVVDPFYEHIPAFFGMDLDALLEAKHPTAWVEFETGRIGADEYYASMFADGRSFDGRALEHHISTRYRYVDGIESLLDELSSRGHEMHALSNYPVWYRLVEERLRLSRYLPWTFVSCVTGLRKPASAAFEHAARRVGRHPSRCLVVDDRAANCDAAVDAGMATIRFEDSDQLRRELSALRLL